MFIIVYVRNYSFGEGLKLNLRKINIEEYTLPKQKLCYELASRLEFKDQQEAIDYAINLAKVNDIEYVGIKKVGDSLNMTNVLD